MADPSYFGKYNDLAFERTDDGILTLRFQTSGGPIVFTGQTHEDLPKALEEVALDADNNAMIITGTGDVFMDNIDGASLVRFSSRPRGRRSAAKDSSSCSAF
jgi:enoyl-CoA hydratase/carnithine racemase